MTPVPLLAIALLAGWPDADASTERASYEKARAEAGRTPDDQVRLALWCEAHGLAAERLKHLAQAILRDPSHAKARGMMGLVAYKGKWQSPEAVADKLNADRKLADALAAYNGRRERMSDTADDHWRLALWCEANGLAVESTAHLTSVVRLDPSREVAWRKLGYTRRDGRWMTDAQLAEARADAEARAVADRTLTPALKKWQAMLSRVDTRSEAEAGLVGIADPLAVGPIVRVFGSSGKVSDQLWAVRLLGQIETPASSQALAILASRPGDAEVRRAAREVLSHRDPREFVGLLLARLGRLPDQVRYQMGTVADQMGRLHPSLLVEGKKHDLQIDSDLTVDHRKLPIPGRLFADYVPQGSLVPGMMGDWDWSYNGSDPFAWSGLWAFAPVPQPGDQAAVIGFLKGQLPPGTKFPHIADKPNAAGAMVAYYTRMAMIRDAQIAQAMAWNASQPIKFGPNFQATVSATMAEADASNAVSEANRTEVYATLRQSTKQNLPDDAEAWKTWYADALGFSYRSPGRQRTEQAEPRQTLSFTIISCFAAGTPVRTIAGDRPIEALRVGDQVLSQDMATGALAYRPITRVHHNPPSEVLRVRMGGETILATGFHRFWKAGKGWVMARELVAGDMIRTLGGLASVESVEPDRVQPVFNLDVAGYADFFVGKAGALVHDNTLPDPRVLPFDAVRIVAAVRRDK